MRAERDDPLDRLSTIVHAERRGLVAIARSEGLSAEEALECVQDALCAMLADERSGAVPPAEHAIASLKIRVRNTARNLRRRHHRKAHEGFEELGDDERPDAEALLAHAEEVVRLRTCVAELCGVQRSVVMLRLLDERSGEDVAEALGLARGHVDVLVHRAKASLRLCMRSHHAPTR